MSGIGGHTLPNRGQSDSWITPKKIIDDLGEFDFDPCQCIQQPWKCARNGATIEQDGLSLNWPGRVWLNPPYSNVAEWMEKLADHNKGTALVFARTETKWFVSQVWGRATGIKFLHGRLFFHRPDGTRGTSNAGGPSCLVAYGEMDFSKLVVSKLNGTTLRIKE